MDTEKLKAYRRKYYLKNRERLLQKAREHRWANRENFLAEMQFYRDANRDKFNMIHARYREKTDKNLMNTLNNIIGTIERKYCNN